MGALLLLLVLVLSLGAAFVPSTAHAAADSVTGLAVDFNIQPDGSVDVRYELDWRFGSDGRHGIDFGIATREVWDADRSMDVIYEVSDIAVASPSGAPAMFTREDQESGSVGRISLRIGDPDQTVEGRDATYVISYVIKGALRTFDGRPELFWDVTGNDYPDIEAFRVTITAPGDVQEARCLMGEQDCGSAIEGGAAVLTGRDVASSTVLSVAAAMVPGAVANAEPVLEKPRIDHLVMTGITSSVEVSSDGMTHVEQQMTYLLPDDAAEHPPLLRWSLPVRRPFSRTEDQVFRITNLTVDGAASVEQRPLTDRDRYYAHQDVRIDVRPEASDTTRVLTLSYDVAGAVVTEADTAHARWVLAPVELSDANPIHFTWLLPADVQRVDCTTTSRDDKRRECIPSPALVAAGNTVTWRRNGEGRLAPADAWVGSDVAAASVGRVGPILEPGVDAAHWRDRAIGVGGGVVALAGAVALIVGLARVRPTRDRRWADVPPGVRDTDGGVLRPARRSDVVPVRFEEPACSLTMAGLVLDGRPSPRHTAALLVHMAVLGAVRVRSEPLIVTKITDAPLDDHVEKQLYKAATLRDTPLSREALMQMGSTVDSRQKALTADRDKFLPLRSEKPLPLHRDPVAWGLAAIAVVFPVAWIFVPGWLGPHGFLVVAGAVAGAVFGLYRAERLAPRRSLEPGGTALRDQVRGFRRYIATAEAEQLDFEADQNIYRRYLPWAVLFGLTKRWTRVCEELVAAGQLPGLDTSFWVGEPSPGAIAASMSGFRAPLRSAVPAAAPVDSSSSSSSSGGFFSGGGSGGSSGFSGGSSGGGGGGGTSASSW